MNIVARAFIFKYRFLWLGWYLVKREDPAPLYFDDTKYIDLHSQINIPYLTIGFTEKGVMKRIHRYAQKHYSDD